MITSVVINDYKVVPNSVVRIDLMVGPEEYARVESYWERRDTLLLSLQEEPAFKGRERFCDLDIAHYRLLVTLSMRSFMALDDAARYDTDHPVVLSLHNLLAAMAMCFERRVDAHLDLLRIDRHADGETGFVFGSSTPAGFDNLPRRRPGLRVIVDNTGA